MLHSLDGSRAGFDFHEGACSHAITSSEVWHHALCHVGCRVDGVPSGISWRKLLRGSNHLVGRRRLHANERNAQRVFGYCSDPSILPRRVVLMQKRTGPSVNFYKDWISYRRGFGDETNFWLGNENLHSLTSGGARLRVVLTASNRTVRYAEYSLFTVAGEDQNFRAVFDEYSGTAGDALTYHSGCEFSTFGADHDKESGICAERYFGGWWYNACHYANLDVLYLGPGPVILTELASFGGSGKDHTTPCEAAKCDLHCVGDAEGDNTLHCKDIWARAREKHFTHPHTWTHGTWWVTDGVAAVAQKSQDSWS